MWISKDEYDELKKLRQLKTVHKYIVKFLNGTTKESVEVFADEFWHQHDCAEFSRDGKILACYNNIQSVERVDLYK